MKKVDLKIIIPGRSDGEKLSDGLRTLTKAIQELTPDKNFFYVLGGEFGYGADYENDVFEMHPFNWEEECSDGCPFVSVDWEPHVQHTEDCYQTELGAREAAVGLGMVQKGDNWDYRNPKLAYDERRRLEDIIYKELTMKYGLPMHSCAIHCTCDFGVRLDAWLKENQNEHVPSCRIVRPNFRHKPTGFTVNWYKWIGRSNEVDAGSCTDTEGMLTECVQSL